VLAPALPPAPAAVPPLPAFPADALPAVPLDPPVPPVPPVPVPPPLPATGIVCTASWLDEQCVIPTARRLRTKSWRKLACMA
jgi:hypothetical protein